MLVFLNFQCKNILLRNFHIHELPILKDFSIHIIAAKVKQ